MASASDPGTAPRRLEPGDVDRAARVLARAFAWHEPWGDWAMPDRPDREERIYERFRCDLLERFIPYGECWTIGAGTATTMWIPPGVAEDMFDSDHAVREEVAALTDDGGRRYDALWTWIEERVPLDAYYLDVLGVDPARQGTGVGSALIRFGLDRARADVVRSVRLGHV